MPLRAVLGRNHTDIPPVAPGENVLYISGLAPEGPPKHRDVYPLSHIGYVRPNPLAEPIGEILDPWHILLEL
eukprot:780140-Pyramimonas_sp.AAC.1